ncbi:hypothetical protein DSC45_14820 [Streptomyces sp. YIM 130001]|nr:hypothetical protein DSC45_14820 [Streptomyces sp. YIM 130001]
MRKLKLKLKLKRGVSWGFESLSRHTGRGGPIGRGGPMNLRFSLQSQYSLPNTGSTERGRTSTDGGSSPSCASYVAR